MAKIRLNEGYRDFLTTLARQVVKCPAEAKAEDAAYKAAAPVVRGIVVARYPAKDMAVLLRYQKAAPDECIHIQLTAGGVAKFKFRADESAPLAPEGSCYGRMYLADEAATKVIETYRVALDAHAKALKAKLGDYCALIRGAVHLDEVEEVWPEATQLRERNSRTLPMVLSEDVIKRIKADAAMRMKEAA